MSEIFDYTAVGGTRRVLATGRKMEPGRVYGDDQTYLDFGWVPPEVREEMVAQAHSQAVGEMPPFEIKGSWNDDEEKICLWDCARAANNNRDFYIFYQKTGSCVGNGGGQAVWNLSAVEVVRLRDPEQVLLPFYLLPYGRSRYYMGDRGRGEGSLGSTFAKAIAVDGILPYNTPGLPQPITNSEGDGITWGQAVEYEWSDGGAISDKWLSLSRKHLVKTVSQIKNGDQAWEALSNYYPMTIASMWGGNMTPSVKDGVLLNKRVTSWAHQMCCPPETYVDGLNYEPIAKVRVGDLVRGHDGNLHRVTNTIRRHHDGEMVVIKASGRLPLRLTPGHPVLVFQKVPSRGPAYVGVDYNTYGGGRHQHLEQKVRDWEKTQPKWIPIEDIQPGDYLVCPAPTYSDNKDDAVLPVWPDRPLAKNQPTKIETADDDLAWLFGLYVADGNTVEDHKVVITLGRHQLAVIDKAVEVFKKIGLEATVHCEGQFARVTVYSATAAEAFDSWFGTKCLNKHLPDWLFTGWSLREVIKGIVDGDGCWYAGAWRISTTSAQLRDQIYSILLFLGEYPYVDLAKWDKAPETWNDLWIIRWRLDPEKRKYNRWWKGLYLTPVRKVSRERYVGDVHNIEVEGVESYLVSGVAIHNCSLARWRHPTLGKLFWIQNSWGPKAHGRCPTGAPPGGFWVTFADMDWICRTGECYAFSQFQGFPAQYLPRELFRIFGV